MAKPGSRAFLRRAILASACVAIISACSPIMRSYGYTPSDLDLSELTVGKDNRESVARAIGTPQASGLSNENTWFYASSLYRTNGLFTPEELEREIVAVSFTESGTLANIERYGLENGQVVTVSRRVTNPAVQNSTFVRQLFDSIGSIPLEGL